jgi:hypothetical protein
MLHLLLRAVVPPRPSPRYCGELNVNVRFGLSFLVLSRLDAE